MKLLFHWAVGETSTKERQCIYNYTESEANCYIWRVLACFRWGSADLDLLRSVAHPNDDVSPDVTLSAAYGERIKRFITGEKLRNIIEMYESYIPR